MANYNRLKAQKASPIGTIMPWTGSTSQSALAPDAIPKGWIVLNGDQLKAKDYPLLAQILGNEYGPFTEPGQPFVGISNSYPNYTDDDVFNLPTLSQQALIDLEGNQLSPQDQAAVGTYISDNGYEGTQPLTNVLSYIDINFSVEVEGELSGKIRGLSFEEPSFFDTVRTIPRKLGIEHTAAHTHPRPPGEFYPSVEITGTFVGLFEAGRADYQDSEYVTVADAGLTSDEPSADRFVSGTISWTPYDPNSSTLPDMNNFRHFGDAPDLVPIIPTTARNVAPYGFTGGASGYLDDNSCIKEMQQQAVTAPFPPPGLYLGSKNYYTSDQVPLARRSDGSTPPPTDEADYYNVPSDAAGRDFPYPTTLNHNGDAFTANSMGSHNHFTIDIAMTLGQMNIPSTILINNMTTGNIEPIDVDRSLSVQVNPNTPSLVTLYIIRAY